MKMWKYFPILLLTAIIINLLISDQTSPFNMSQDRSKVSLLNEALIQIGSGGSAGIVNKLSIQVKGKNLILF